jgi:hypothetical protein
MGKEEAEERADKGPASIVPASPSVVPSVVSERVPLRMYARTYWYRFRANLRSWAAWQSGLVTFGFWFAVLVPAVEASLKKGAAYIAFAVLLSLLKALRHSRPENMKLVRREYFERKALMYKLVRQMHRRHAMSAQEIKRFQQDALGLVASYVRGHRADSSGTVIFANLLVEDGDDLVVVARDSYHYHRSDNARYPKHSMVAWYAMQAMGEVFVGDVKQVTPELTARKPYRSVLAIPLVTDTGDGSGTHVVGVVSIDSAEPNHFDIEAKKLSHALMPYLALLGWTLTPAQNRPTKN